MRATVYKQIYDEPVCSMEFTDEEIASGFGKRPCRECQGTGVFVMPDDSGETCNACKGQGTRWVNLW